MVPKGNMMRRDFVEKTLMLMPLEHAGELMVCKAPCSTFKRPEHLKSRAAHIAQTLVEGIALAPGTC